MERENRGPVAVVLTFVVLTVIMTPYVIANLGWWPPDTFAGDVPEVDHAIGFVGRSVVEETHEATLTWTLAPMRSASTTMSVAREDGPPAPVGHLFGTLAIDDAGDCPGAVVDWALTPTPLAAPAPPLTADAPESTALDRGPTRADREVHLDLRRADTADCEVVVVWERASFHGPERPPASTPGLPGMGGAR